MFDNLKNEFAKKTKETLFMRQAKDIFEDDKLLQAEKRLQKYMQSIFNGYSFFLIGGGLLFYSFILISIYISSWGGFALLLVGIVLALVGIWCCYLGFIRFPQYKRFPLYLSAIADSKDGSLDKIANTVGYPYETVIADIEFLIQKDILERTYINHSKRVIVSILVGESVSKSTSIQNCPNCGATVTFLGKSTECDYCGSNISLKQ